MPSRQKTLPAVRVSYLFIPRRAFVLSAWREIHLPGILVGFWHGSCIRHRSKRWSRELNFPCVAFLFHHCPYPDVQSLIAKSPMPHQRLLNEATYLGADKILQ